MGRLLDVVREERASRAHTGPPCAVCELLDQLPKTERADLETALKDRTIFATDIVRALRKLGHRLEDRAIRRHRNGDCFREQQRDR